MSLPLSDLNILALDCQTTGANPEKGHLLEIGWVKTRASEARAPLSRRAEFYLLKLPVGAEIPRAVQRVTGITAETMANAAGAQQVCAQLDKSSREVAQANQAPSCLTIIHFARFEMPFLRQFQQSNHSRHWIPLHVICTHEIVKRLFPELPRRGLRAIAGYFGHCMPESRRCAAHAAATAIVWQNVVKKLKTDHHVTTLAHLSEWLKSDPIGSKSGRVYPMRIENRRNLPDKPGIYRMRRSNGDLLYVGKAKSLKQRINSYFRQSAAHAERTLEMLTQARDLDVTLTVSALEAAVLESDEIKRHSPPYNIALRSRQRALVYVAKNLRQHTCIADENHPIGPLPAGHLVDALAAFANLCEDPIPADDAKFAFLVRQFLGLPREYAPGLNCLRKGFEAFQRQHENIFRYPNSLRALTGLGAALWRERFAAPAPGTSGNSDIDAQAPAAAEKRVWTPEDVVRSMESVIRHGAHMIRRARWFCQLSESSLAWQSPNVAAGEKIVIVFEKGDVILRENSKAIPKPPTPPGHANSLEARRQNVDVIVYDRLRVVTTELRRLVPEMRDVALRLGPKVILRNPQLEKVLRWV